MPRKPREINLQAMLQKIKVSGIDGSPAPNRQIKPLDELPTLEERVNSIIETIKSPNANKGNMLFFIMYDIESNKVRRIVARYLEKKGCMRVQGSVFLANLDTQKYEQIRNDLTDVQAYYDNHDSILICPVSTDLIKCMKIIGKNINIDLIIRSKSTIFLGHLQITVF